MRLLSCTLLLSLAMTIFAWARLGETPEQLEARLGPAAQIKRVDQVYANGRTYPVGQIWNFGKDGWSVECVFVNGKCAKITYVKPSSPLTDEDINTILNNEAQGSKWAESVSTTTVIDSIFAPMAKVREWKRADGADARIIYNSFTLTAPEYQRAVDAANQQAKAEAAKKMPNL